MVSLPSRKQLPALCLLVLVGLFCVLWVGGTLSLPSADNSYSVRQTDKPVYSYDNLPADAQQLITNAEDYNGGNGTGEQVRDEFRTEEQNIVLDDGRLICVFISDSGLATVQDCPDIAFQFENLSAHGQWTVSSALNSPDNHVEIHQDSPREFTAGGSDTGFSPPGPDGPSVEGYYYLIKNGTLYELSVYTGSWFPGIVSHFVYFVGIIAATAVGGASYYGRSIKLTVPFLVTAPLFIGYPLVRAILSTNGQYQQVRWLDQQSLVSNGVKLFIVASIGVFFYHVYREFRSGNRRGEAK